MPITIDPDNFKPIFIRTVPVFEEEYLGDSLGKINYNFFVLDTALSNLSAIFFYQQSNSWKNILDDLHFYLPSLSSFGDYIYTKENYVRFNTMYNTVKALSAYWGKMEVHVIYPFNFFTRTAVLDFNKIVENNNTEILSLARQYCYSTFNPNNHLDGSKVRVGFLVYNKIPLSATNLVASFSNSPSGVPASFYYRDNSLDPGIIYRNWQERIKEKTLSIYSLPINELIAFSRKQLEDLGFTEIECSLITTFSLLSQWHHSVVSIGTFNGTREENDSYYTYLETRPRVSESFKNHLNAINWFTLCKDLILALSKKYIHPQSNFFNSNDSTLADPRKTAFAQTTIDWIKGRVGPYFNFSGVDSLNPGKDQNAIKKSLFKLFLDHLSTWYIVTDNNFLSSENKNNLFEDDNIMEMPQSQTTKLQYPFKINKQTFTIPNRQPEERVEISLGDFSHYKKNSNILARSDKDFPLSILNQTFIWNQNTSVMDTTFQLVPSYIAGVIFIEFVLKNQKWIHTRFIPFQMNLLQ